LDSLFFCISAKRKKAKLYYFFNKPQIIQIKIVFLRVKTTNAKKMKRPQQQKTQEAMTEIWAFS